MLRVVLDKIILDFCNEVNSTISVLPRELEEESKKKQLSKDAVDSPKNNPNLRQKQSFIDAGRPTLQFETIPLEVYNSKVYLAGKHTWNTVNITCCLKEKIILICFAKILYQIFKGIP